MAADGSSFVSHWIVVQKSLMVKFLDALCPNPTSEKSSNGCKWPENILKNLPEDDLNTGFSEYHSYVSFVKQNWPETQYEMKEVTWVRNPVGERVPKGWKDNGLCCPTWWQHYHQWRAGYQYYGVEAGHAAQCRWTDKEFETYYGPKLKA
jgi:hypothetical protein